jgi:hypothetical protein
MASRAGHQAYIYECPAHNSRKLVKQALGVRL